MTCNPRKLMMGDTPFFRHMHDIKSLAITGGTPTVNVRAFSFNSISSLNQRHRKGKLQTLIACFILELFPEVTILCLPKSLTWMKTS